MSTRTSRPVSASIERELADVGELVLARVADLDDEHAVALGDGGQLRQPVERAAEVGDQDDQAAARGAPRATKRSAASGDLTPSLVAVDVGRPRRRAAARAGRPARRAAGALRVGAAAEGQHAQAVAALRGEVADGDRDALGDVRLAAIGGAERHRRRDVEQQPGRQRALRDVDPDVGQRPSGRWRSSRCAGRRRPARTAGPGRAPCRRRARAPELARDEAADPAPDRQVERAQERLRRGAGSGSRRRAGAAAGSPETTVMPCAARDAPLRDQPRRRDGRDDPGEEHVRR